jgi:hypothetical protein
MKLKINTFKSIYEVEYIINILAVLFSPYTCSDTKPVISERPVILTYNVARSAKERWGAAKWHEWVLTSWIVGFEGNSLTFEVSPPVWNVRKSLYTQWWRFHMEEKFSSRTFNSTESISPVLHSDERYNNSSQEVPCSRLNMLDQKSKKYWCFCDKYSLRLSFPNRNTCESDPCRDSWFCARGLNTLFYYIANI